MIIQWTPQCQQIILIQAILTVLAFSRNCNERIERCIDASMWMRKIGLKKSWRTFTWSTSRNFYSACFHCQAKLVKLLHVVKPRSFLRWGMAWRLGIHGIDIAVLREMRSFCSQCKQHEQVMLVLCYFVGRLWAGFPAVWAEQTRICRNF
jgi:hypothetical protein